MDIVIGGYAPGALGRVTELHGRYYHRHWDFGAYFECKVASEMAEFLGRFDAARDGFWLAQADGRIVGSVTVDGAQAGGEGARIRWFVLDEAYQGHGIGRMLMQQAMAFCRDAGFERVYLWTFEGLHAARHLYEQFGFTLCREHDDDQWGKTVREQLFAWHPPAA